MQQANVKPNSYSCIFTSFTLAMTQYYRTTYRIYPNRNPGVYFLYMIFALACKQVQHLFKPRRLFPIVYLSRVEWQVLVPVFMSLITWLEVSTFIKVYGLHSLTGVVKLVSASWCGKTTNVINTL